MNYAYFAKCSRLIAISVMQVFFWESILYGQFFNVINVPPDVAPESVGSQTQLNVFDGGSVPSYFDAGLRDGSNTNIEVNISGGDVGWRYYGREGSQTNISGGVIDNNFYAEAGSGVSFSGGSLGDGLTINSSASFVIAGSEFRIDGLPITGIEDIGDELQFELPEGSILSGTLSDGTPFAFSSQDGDDFGAGTTTLVSSELPVVQPPLVVASVDPIPLGIREGQTLVVPVEARVGDHFNAGYGSTTIVSGGEVGRNLEVVGGTLVVSGGSVGDDVDAWNGSSLSIADGTIGEFLQVLNSTVSITGGTIGNDLSSSSSTINAFGGNIGEYFTAESESTVNIMNGTIGNRFRAYHSTVNINGGCIGDNFYGTSGSTIYLRDGYIGFVADIHDGSVLHVTGGHVKTGFDAGDGSAVMIEGGAFGDAFRSMEGSEVHLSGVDFLLDGQPIEGLNAEGDSVQIDIPDGSVLTGTLADGTPFLFSSEDDHAPPMPPRISAVTSASTEAALLCNATENSAWYADYYESFSGDTLVDQTITLHQNAIPNDIPSLIHIPGDISPLGIHQGQTLILSPDGRIGDNFNVGLNSVFVVVGGEVGTNLELYGATVVINGGYLGSKMDAFGGSNVALSAGTIGNHAEFHNSFLTVTGGEVEGNLLATDHSIILVSGGNLGHSTQLINSTLDMSQGEIGDFLSVGEESSVSVSGGSIGDYAEVLSGGVINMTGGTLGDDTEVYEGGIVNLSGGTIGERLQANHGGRVNILGDTTVGSIRALSGSVVSLAGGSISTYVVADEGSTVNISGGTFDGEFAANSGSTVNIYAAQFYLDGFDITESLIPDMPWTLDDRDVVLSGILADGSLFSFELVSTSPNQAISQYFSFDATITLTRQLTMDFDGDGDIDETDLAYWQDGYGESTDGQDFLLWMRNYGTAESMITTTATVPEPNALGLILIGVFLVFITRVEYNAQRNTF